MGGNGPEVEKVLEPRINTGYYRLCLVVTATCAKWQKSSPTLSAKLLRIDDLYLYLFWSYIMPQSRTCFTFGMSHMHLYLARVASH